jgi:hypothetical protein
MAIKLLPKIYHPGSSTPNKKPLGEVELDFSSSLAHGLHSSFILNETAGKRVENLANCSKPGKLLSLSEVSRKTAQTGNRALATNGNSNSIIRLEPTPAIALNESFAWVCRFKFITGSGDGLIFGNRYGGQGSPLRFTKLTPSKFEYYPSASIDSSASTSWQTVVINKTGNYLEYFENGITVGAQTVTINMPVNPVSLGGDATNNNERLSAEFEFFHTYNRALTSAEIQTFQNDAYQLAKPVQAPVYFTEAGGAISVTGAITLPSLVFTGSATDSTPEVTAAGAITLPSLVFTGSATDSTPEVTAAGAITLPSLVLTGSATDSTPEVTAAGAITLPSLVFTGSATDSTPEVTATGAVTLPSLVFTGSATDSTPGVIATGAITLPSLVFTGSATDSTPEITATGAITLPSLVFSGTAGDPEVTPDFSIIIDVSIKTIQTTAKS